MSDEIWADSRGEQAESASRTMSDLSATISSIHRSIHEIDTLHTGRDLIVQIAAWLRALSSDQASGTAETLRAIGHQYNAWMRETGSVSDTLWFQLAEVGSWLAVHGNPEPLRAFQTTALCSTTVPHKEAFCDRQRQVSFSIRLFDAMCASVMRRASGIAASLVIEVFVLSLGRVMEGYEFFFLHHVSHPLAEHIRQTCSAVADTLAKSSQAVMEALSTKEWNIVGPSLAVTVILLSASSHEPAIHSIQARVVQKLRSDEVFPHVHSPIAIVAVALQAAPIAVTSSTMLQQFVLLRVIHLALVSPQLQVAADDFKRLCERYQETFHRSQLSEDDVKSCLRMMEAAVHELQVAMEASPAVSSAILSAMRLSSETELFRPPLVALHEEFVLKAGDSASEFPAKQFLSDFYDAISIGIQAFSLTSSSALLIDCFATLARLEFARECTAPTQRNSLMANLTQRVEGHIETAPDETLSTLALSVLRPAESTKRDYDVAFGWACYAVGLIVQRKLRVVLFQTSEATRRDVLAVVFYGLYHGLEPLHSFSNRFLSFALSSLGQFVSVYELFPFYLQETIRRYPADVTQQQVASALGTVFGALYYTSSALPLTEEAKKIEATAAETRHAMIMWALRQVAQRVKDLLSTSDASSGLENGLYLTEIFAEVAKMAPVELLPSVARELEAVVHHSAQINEKVLHETKTRVFNAVSVNCEAEKRAWLAAWFLELSATYPISLEVSSDAVRDGHALDASSTSASSQTVSRL